MSTPLIAIFLLSFIHLTPISTAAPDVAHFQMFHRHSPKLAEHLGDDSLKPPATRAERVRDLLRVDATRQEVVHHTLRLGRASVLKRNVTEVAEIPLRSAADEGRGEYFVSVNLGTPPQRFVLIVDTGSCLTWVRCQYKCANCMKQAKGLQINKTFHAYRSSTFKTIPCRSETCAKELASEFSLAICPEPMAPCKYNYRYVDGTESQGFFANETLTVKLRSKRKSRLRDVMIGCSESFTGRFHNIDGIMGLGFNTNSLAVKLALHFGKKFSYCLVDHLSSMSLVNLLSFGPLPYSFPNLQSTELIITELAPYYFVNVTGVGVGGKLLNIPPSIWRLEHEGGVILDSGSSLTYLAPEAYGPVMAALKAPLSIFKRADLQIFPMEYCVFTDGRFTNDLVPPLTFHFADGAKFSPPVKSYIIDADEGVKCIGLALTTKPGAVTVIGNILQQNHFWEFDFWNNKLRFAPSTCDHII